MNINSDEYKNYYFSMKGVEVTNKGKVGKYYHGRFLQRPGKSQKPKVEKPVLEVPKPVEKKSSFMDTFKKKDDEIEDKIEDKYVDNE